MMQADGRRPAHPAGKRIRKVRKKRGWTQVVMAERVGLDRSSIADVERGKRNISVLNLDLITSEADLDEAAERLNEQRRRLAEKQSSENDSRTAQTELVAECRAIQ